MKLYDVPRKTWIRVVAEEKVPPAAPKISVGDEIFFDHIDGMYSFCKDKAGNIVHLVAWADVELIGRPV